MYLAPISYDVHRPIPHGVLHPIPYGARNPGLYYSKQFMYVIMLHKTIPQNI